MEVDAVSFPSHLLDMLGAISDADFVSIDLELSGVASKGNRGGLSKQTLEERYAELKQCAEKYQILQVGITAVKLDVLSDTYIFRPYNINISPLIDDRLDLERIFSFQSGAVEFLLRHGFQFDLPFRKGVQYLSRHEAALAKELAWNRLEGRHAMQDLQLNDDAVESLDFVDRVRTAIIAWIKQGKETLYITSSIGKDDDSGPDELSRFEKRLVHQLVRAEFPNLVTISKPTYILIIEFNAEREAEIVEKRKRQFEEQIVRQTGFRWVIEALAKGNLHVIEPRYFARNRDGSAICANMDEIERRYKAITDRVRRRQPVLVGHNCFTDLVYLYRTFLGQLPDTVDEFSKAIHNEFSVIVDTKYMATHNCGDINPTSSLQDIADHLSVQPLPRIVVHQDHFKYRDTEVHHEAGYDSLLTAEIMVRLSAQLEAKGGYLEGVDPADLEEANQSPPEEDWDTVVPAAGPQLVAKKVAKKKKKKKAGPKPAWDVAEEAPAFKLLDPIQRGPLDLMPAFDSKFWRVYGNKLRIFGTEESILKLGN